VVLDVAVHGVEAALTARTPEERVQAEAHGGCDAVGRTGGDGDRIGEEHRVRVEDQRQLVVVPQRIDLGEVGEVEAAPLQAREVGHDLEPVEDRVGVEVRLVEGASVTVTLRAREPRGFRRGNAGVQVQAAE
jgi:hypothetical protein